MARVLHLARQAIFIGTQPLKFVVVVTPNDLKAQIWHTISKRLPTHVINHMNLYYKFVFKMFLYVKLFPKSIKQF